MAVTSMDCVQPAAGLRGRCGRRSTRMRFEPKSQFPPIAPHAAMSQQTDAPDALTPQAPTPRQITDTARLVMEKFSKDLLADFPVPEETESIAHMISEKVEASEDQKTVLISVMRLISLFPPVGPDERLCPELSERLHTGLKDGSTIGFEDGLLVLREGAQGWRYSSPFDLVLDISRRWARQREGAGAVQFALPADASEEDTDAAAKVFLEAFQAALAQFPGECTAPRFSAALSPAGIRVRRGADEDVREGLELHGDGGDGERALRRRDETRAVRVQADRARGAEAQAQHRQRHACRRGLDAAPYSQVREGYEAQRRDQHKKKGC
eukprot:gnl/Chilomastix_cuspidata/3349.p1 GENE.gnl/Chilomastix_cuspidata/3349~~gnl/Chilomastix_cuspidata/3349.p1  ORF type:complete len:325 (+),score=87.18 gnl/Chilomastix_cuspidata/3349:652-1626(+)